MKLRYLSVPVGAALIVSGAVPSAATVATAPPTCQGKPASIVGTDGRDNLAGTSGRDIIAGLGKNDEIDGGGGNDLICGGKGADTLRGGFGRDRLFGQRDGIYWDDPPQAVGDTLVGGPGDDYFDGGEADGVDEIDYSGSDHPVNVNLATSVVTTSQSTDRIAAGSIEGATGSRFRDRLLGSARADYLHGGPSRDRLIGRQEGDVLFGDRGDDRLRSGAGGDIVWGEAGDDTAYASVGDDYINGDGGHDSADAGVGDDTCVDVEDATSCQ